MVENSNSSNHKSPNNFIHGGRPKFYEEKKTTHNITVTPVGWKGIQQKAQNLGYRGVSELVEQIGRGQLCVIQKTSNNEPTDYLSHSTDDLQKQLQQLHNIKQKMENVIGNITKISGNKLYG